MKLARLNEADIPATGVVSLSTRITCAFDLTGKATGYWDVVVTTGSSSYTLTQGFTIGSMQVYSVAPAVGYNTGPVGITDLRGAGFPLSGVTVKLARPNEADIPATSVVSLSTRITCTFDLTGKATGYWDVVGTTGSSSYTLLQSFNVGLMRAYSVAPASGYNTGPVNITDLRGAGFPLSGVTVKLARLNEADIPATGVISISTRITCAFDLTGKATGYWDVVVTTGSSSYTLIQGFEIGLMQVYSVAPALGNNTGPVNITDLSGAGFPLSGVTVKLTRLNEADIPATGVISISTRITCAFDLTGKATGYWDVVVTTGSSSYTLSQGFEIGLMRVYSVAPAVGYNTGPVNITDLSGAGFPLSGVTVKLTRLNEADIPATGVVSLSTRITCAFDLTGKATGYWDVVVSTGSSSYTLSQGFEIGLMQVYSAAPAVGYNTGPVNITDLRGAGFPLSGVTVKLARLNEADIPATGVVSLSTRITCAFDLTGKATGYWDVVVSTGSSSQTLPQGFEIGLMQVYSILPAAGYNTGPVNITDLRGAGFPLSGVTVKLTRLNEADIPATGVVSLSTRITCAFDLTGKATGYWDVVVTTGSSSQTLSQGFEIGLMQVYSVAPAAGNNTGPVVITDLRGAGFIAGSTVALTRNGEDAIPATDVNVVFSTQITCSFDLLGGATGYWDIVVTTGAVSRTLTGGFEIRPMQITAITPAAGYNTGAVSITDLHGEGFPSSGITVKLVKADEADITATGVSVVGSTRILCSFDMSGKAAGYWDVVVSTGGPGSLSATLSNGFLSNAVIINSIAPDSGYNTGTVLITDLEGEGFASYLTQVKLVRLNQSTITATEVNVVSPNKITCRLDLTGKTTGYWDVVVTSGAFSHSLAGGFNVKPGTITSVTPDFDSNIGSTTVVIAGNGFLAGSTVTLSKAGETSIDAGGVDVTASDSITCEFDLTGKAAGFWTVTVTSGAFVYTLADGFEIKPLTITLVTPVSGYNNGSVTTELDGFGMQSGSTVALTRSGQPDIPGTGVDVQFSTHTVCTFDLNGMAAGYWDVVITSGLSVYTLTNGFLVNSLTLASISPDSWYNSGAVEIADLQGGGFAAGATVKLTKTGQDDISAAGVSIVSPAQIACSFELTGKATGYWNVVVSTGGTGSLSSTLTNGFFVNSLGVASITPVYAYNSGLVDVPDLRGAGFAAGATVKLAKTGQTDIPATGVNIVYSSRIACSFDLTGKATGYWNVVVSTGGTGSLSATLSNGIFVSSLAVTSITPGYGFNSGTVSVTDLHGSGFSAGAAVKLARAGQDDIPATGVSIAPSQIACSFALTGKTTGYWDVVVSTGGIGALTAVLAQAFEVRSPVAGTTELDGTIDVSVTLELESGEIKLDIPAGAFDESVSLTVSTAQVPAADRGTIALSAIGVEITNDKGLQPVKNSVMTMSYRHSDIVGLDETKLAVGRYDPANSRWLPLPSTAYPAQNKVTCIVDHFSVFGLLQLKPASDLGSVKVFPNPFDPGRHKQGLTIDNLTSEAEIKIFTITGELVKKVDYTDRNGRAKWYGVNEAGKEVASGVYIALVKAPGGNKKIKIAVEK